MIELWRRMNHALTGLPEFSQQHCCSGWSWGCYFSTSWLLIVVCNKFYECTEHSADRNSLRAEPGLWPHMAWWSTHLLQEYDWEVLIHHPSYSPDLTLSDFHLFLHLTKFLSGQHQHFQNDRDVYQSGSQSQVADFYNAEYTVIPVIWQMSQFRRWICWK